MGLAYTFHLVVLLLGMVATSYAHAAIYHTMLFVKVVNYTQPISDDTSVFTGTCCRTMQLENCTHFCETVFSVSVGRGDNTLFNITYSYDTSRPYDNNYGVERINIPSLSNENITIDVFEIQINIRTGSKEENLVDRFTKRYDNPPSTTFWLGDFISWQLQNKTRVSVLVSVFCESNWFNNCSSYIPADGLHSVQFSPTENKFLPQIDCRSEATSKIEFNTTRPYKYSKKILEAVLAKFVADKVCSSVTNNITMAIFNVRYESPILRVVFNSSCLQRHKIGSQSIADEFIEMSDLRVMKALFYMSHYEEKQYFMDSIVRPALRELRAQGKFQILFRVKKFLNPRNKYYEWNGMNYYGNECPSNGCAPAFHFEYYGFHVALEPRTASGKNLVDCFGYIVNPDDTTDQIRDSILLQSDKVWDKKEPLKLSIYHQNNEHKLIARLNFSLEETEVISSYLLAKSRLIETKINSINVSVQVEVMVWCTNGHYDKMCNGTCPASEPDCNVEQCTAETGDSNTIKRLFHCRNKGQCNNGVCNCPADLAGRSCNIKNIYGRGAEENFKGNVITNGSSNKIQCYSGYKGFQCSEIDYCSSNPCNHGQCIGGINKYSCKCENGFIGYRCDFEDVGSCKNESCKNNGTCFENICKCMPGFTGNNCELNIDDCENVTCEHNGTCNDRMLNFTCSCLEGFTGRKCELNIDDCENVTCENNGTCIDQTSTYACNCLDGFTGRNCELNIDDCENVTCENNGTCIDQTLNYTCNCIDGFKGRNCELNIDDCENVTCENNGTCIDQTLKYTCNCLDGFKGRNCELNIDDCENVTCENNGTCIDQTLNYTCNCLDGFKGRNCELNIDDCENVTCENNGTCIDQTLNYTCNCLNGFTGRKCDFNIDDCENVVCRNNGTCIDRTATYTCLCSTGYTGKYCESPINICSNPMCSRQELKLEDGIYSSCTSSGWNITVNMTVLQQLYPNITTRNIHFGDSSCPGREVGTLLVFQQGFEECLTSKLVTGNTLMYMNDLFYAIYDPIMPFIIRQYKWTYTVECDVTRNEATSSHVHHDVDSHNTVVTGHYNISMTFFKDVNYLNQLPGNPLHANVGDDVYVKVFTMATDWTVKMRLHTCYTKPLDIADENTVYYLIKDGCEVDSNTHIISQSTHETRFVFQDFGYTSNREGLNIYCNATFCETQDYSSGCAQSCASPGIGPGTQTLIGK